MSQLLAKELNDFSPLNADLGKWISAEKNLYKKTAEIFSAVSSIVTLSLLF